MKKLLILIFFSTSIVWAQGNIPSTTYTTLPTGVGLYHGPTAPSPTTCSQGQIFTNDTNGVVYSCNAGTWATVGGTAANTPGIPSYNGPNIVYASNYGVKALGVRFFDASWTNSTKTVTVGNNPTETDLCVTSAMIGWLIAGMNGPTTTPNRTATNLLGYPATITAVASCTSFTVSNTPSVACTSSAGNSLCQLVIAPNDDYDALNAAFVAMMGGTTACNGKLVLPQGIMWLSQPPRGSFPCGVSGNANGSATGYYIEGAGADSTIIFPAPSGSWTVGSNQGTLFYNTGSVAGRNIHISNLAVDGAGQAASLGSNGYVFALNQNSSLSYVNIFQFGVNGVLCSGGDAAEATVDHINVGGSPLAIQLGNYCKSSHSAYFWATGAGNGAALFSGNPVWSTNDSFDFNANVSGANLLVNSGEAWVTSAIVLSNSTNNPLVYVTSGAILHLSHSKVYNCINGTNGVGITTDSTPSIVYLSDTHVQCTATGGKAINNAGTMYDLGGNTLQGTIANLSAGTYNKNPQVVGSDNQLAKAAAQTAKTLFTVGSATTFFRVHLSVECTTTSAGATVTPSVLYTDTSATVQTITGTAATCTALGASSNTSQDVTFRADTATAIQYQTVIANTPTYDVSVTVEQLGIL